MDAETQQITIAIDGNIFNQLSAEDLQYIDLVLASDLMNPIWSFEVGVELEYEIRRPGSTDSWQVLFAQNGSSRERDGVPVLRAPGAIGKKIEAYVAVVDVNDTVVPSRGPGYPPTEVSVVLHRQSNDESSELFNLYAPAGNAPLIFSDRPLAEMVNVPAGAIVLQDDPELVIFRTCTANDAVCEDSIEYEVLEEIQQQFSEVDETIYRRPLLLARIAVDIGIGCEGEPVGDEALLNDDTFSGGDFWKCKEIIVDWFNSDDPDPHKRREDFIIPWSRRSNPTNLNEVVESANDNGRNYVRFRLAGFEDAKSWEDQGIMPILSFPNTFQVRRQFDDDAPSNPIAEIVTATMLPQFVNTQGRAFITESEANAELARIVAGESEDNPTARAGNSNPLFEDQFQYDDFRPAWPGEPYAVYEFTGANLEGQANIPPRYQSNTRGKRERSTPYFVPEFSIEIAVRQNSDIGPMLPKAFSLTTSLKQAAASTIVQEYWDHYPYEAPAGKRLTTAQIQDATDNLAPIPADLSALGFDFGTAEFANLSNYPDYMVGTPWRIAQSLRNWLNNVESTTLAEVKVASSDFDGFHDDVQELAVGAICASATTPVVSRGATHSGTQNVQGTVGTWSQQSPLTTIQQGDDTYDAATQTIQCGPNLRADTPARSGTDATHPLRLRITSAWRNPERNETVSTIVNSIHQFGRALDLKPVADGQNNVPIGPDRSVSISTLYCLLEDAGEELLNATGNNGYNQLTQQPYSGSGSITENYGLPTRCDGSHPDRPITHVHIQVK